MRWLSLAVLATCVALLLWRSTTSARPYPQESPGVPTALETFLTRVEIDGDGVHTPGDRAVAEWWLAHGGDAQALMAAASEASPGAVRDATAFLASPQAQLTP